MYVKKDELRKAVATRIEHVTTQAPERAKTATELRNEFYALQKTFEEERAPLLQALVESGNATFENFSADRYSARKFYGVVVLTPELAKLFKERKDTLDALEQRYRAQSQLEEATRRSRHGRYGDNEPTSLRELEAWLTRIDNDIKTATVNIKREFASELGLI